MFSFRGTVVLGKTLMQGMMSKSEREDSAAEQAESDLSDVLHAVTSAQQTYGKIRCIGAHCCAWRHCETGFELRKAWTNETKMPDGPPWMLSPVVKLIIA